VTEPGLFELESVVVGQPKRSRWRRYVGPALTMSAVQGAPLACVTYTDDTYALLTDPCGQSILGIEQFGPAEFRFTDAADREVGTADAPGFVKTRRLNLRSEQGRRLLLTRPGLLNTEWHLTESEPTDGGPVPDVLGRVTVSTIDAWFGLQQYVVDMDPRLTASERRTVVASVVCLHLLRRPPGSSSSPA
jgi:hypothetical protein